MARRGLARHAVLAACLALAATTAGALAPAAPGPLGAALRPVAGLLPAAAVAADDGFEIRTSARYVVLPRSRLVRVRIDIRATNRQPDSTSGGVVTRYYFDGLNLGVQPDAVRVRATQDGSALRVNVRDRDGYRLVQVSFARNIFFGETAALRVSFDLPGGEPRSDSGVRVGAAFATFVAWAFGDGGDVRIEVPPGFVVSASGEPVERSEGDDGGIVLTAAAPDAPRWYAWINARNDEGLASDELRIEGGEQIVVRGWPEDRRWRNRVGGLLTDAVPVLVGLVGLPWPVSGPLDVIEVHTPLLEGYAGFYDAATDEITISEDLDELTIVHEASHAWFNRDLFAERWITEGLADEYAARVLDRLDRGYPGPDPVRRDSKAAFALNDWPPPAAIEDEDAAARERYGYDAAWTVMRETLDLVGEEGMRLVLGAAAARTTAYVGDGPAEPTGLPNDWRRFLDLAEEVGGVEGIDDLLRGWALDAGDAGQLGTRDAARDAYHDLLADGDGWAAPRVVRTALDGWAFTDARQRIREAADVLDARDGIEAAAAAESLDPPDDLEAAYEDAASAQALAEAAALAGAERSALDDVAGARRAVERPRDWLADLGLEGATPDTDLAAARRDWESGDLEGATTQAAAVVAVLESAPERGRTKAVTVGGAVGATFAVVIGFLVLRRRRRSPAVSAGPAGPAGGPPGAPDPYATLAPPALPEDVEAAPRTHE